MSQMCYLSCDRVSAVFQNFEAGSRQSFELFVQEKETIQHYYRTLQHVEGTHGIAGHWEVAWKQGQCIGEHASSAPSAFQNWARTGSKYNYELFFEECGQMQHYYRCWLDGKWQKGQCIIA